ncbi:MAG: tRNA 4-thiouridine(8) synthase ThiI, partial [Oscillospiraceae bacterium]|nr:tRNA 4-thiouridine(8) synthase ThiI [Oscillospiraceae bacterium]
GLNRRTFEDILKKNIRISLKPLGDFKIYIAQSTIYVEPIDWEPDFDEVALRVSKIFGIAAFSRAAVAKKDFDDIVKTTTEYLGKELTAAKTFKVEAKRADKSFPLKSPEICANLGEAMLLQYPNLSVDVHSPDVTVTVEVRDYAAYIRSGATRGAGGVPTGTGGNAAVLISGGIDSPVAAYMMAKRGLRLCAIHFASPPYTSPRAEQKVVKLLQKVSLYCGSINMYTVPFTKIQENIRKFADDDYFTLVMRRAMMRIASIIAQNADSKALITGESLGQVASQTLEAIACTDDASALPVFRPLIGMDKEEIIKISRQIDTFETSIEPYEDCCTVFTPKHPRTKPKLKFVKEEEQKAQIESLIDEAVENTVMRYILPVRG